MSAAMAATNIETEEIAPRIPSVWRLLAFGAFVCLLSYSALVLNERSGGITILWPSNGFLLGILLVVPRRQWLAYLAVAYAVDVGINVSLSNPVPISLYLAVCNMVEVLVAAFLLYQALAADPDLTRRRQLAKFLAYGVIVAPAIASFLASFALQKFHSQAMVHTFRLWFTADALGISTVTPLCLAFSLGRQRLKQLLLSASLPAALLCIVTVYVFWQSSFPFLFLVLPWLLFLGLRAGFAGSAMGLLVVSVIGGFFTTAGHGPIGLMVGASMEAHILTFQFFIAISMIVLYLLEVVMAESQRLQQNLQASEAYFRLLAETSRDVIVLTDLDGSRRYVSPAAAELLGWTPEELLGGNYREIVHPEDLDKLTRLLEDCRVGKPEKILPYRCRRKDGSYLWMEANLRLYRDPLSGKPVGFVNVVRDISGRKVAEEELAKAFRLLENLASLDGLTGIANRRRLDQVLEKEWRLASRNGTDISLLLIDVDHFKEFNDLNGHLRGDDCLRDVAKTALDRVSRATDLVARYGGEEFAVILPDTSATGALQIAERMRSAVQALGILHQGNSHGVITVSIGCATRSPKPDSSLDILVHAADNALYSAKAAGRNTVQVAADEVALSWKGV